MRTKPNNGHSGAFCRTSHDSNSGERRTTRSTQRITELLVGPLGKDDIIAAGMIPEWRLVGAKSAISITAKPSELQVPDCTGEGFPKGIE